MKEYASNEFLHTHRLALVSCAPAALLVVLAPAKGDVRAGRIDVLYSPVVYGGSADIAHLGLLGIPNP